MMKKRVDKSGGMELQKLFARGCGVHHAGMQRSDRTLTEQLFEMGLIKVGIFISISLYI
jgi:replicative superfamily II helicase